MGVPAPVTAVSAPAPAAPAASKTVWHTADDVAPGIDPVIRTDARGRTHAVWRTWNATRQDGELYYAHRDASATRWSTPVKLSAASSQRVTRPAFDLALGPNGEIAVVWASGQNFGLVGDPYLRWSKDRGKTWSKSTRVEDAGRSESVQRIAGAFDDRGRLTVAWVIGAADGGAGRLRVSAPTVLGRSLTSTVLERTFWGAFDMSLRVGADGDAVVAWAGLGDIDVRLRQKGSWSAATTVSPEAWGFSMVGSPSTALMPDGSVLVAWQGLQSYFGSEDPLNGVVVSRWDPTTKRWSRTILRSIDRDESFDFEPQMVAQGSRLAVVAVFPGTSAGDRVVAWRSNDRGKTWKTPVPIATTAVGNPRVSMNASGALMLAWLEMQKTGWTRAVAARTLSPSGALSARTVLTKKTDDRELKNLAPKSFGPSISLRADGSGSFVWSDGTRVHSRAFARTLAAPSPRITGTVAVGKKLTAVAGSWTRGTALSYQWYARGKKIPGATAKTFIVKKGQKGASLVVKVTGKKAGYQTVTKASKATKKVR